MSSRRQRPMTRPGLAGRRETLWTNPRLARSLVLPSQSTSWLCSSASSSLESAFGSYTGPRDPALKSQDIFGEAKLKRRSLYEIAEKFDKIAKDDYDAILKQVVEEANREMLENKLQWDKNAQRKIAADARQGGTVNAETEANGEDQESERDEQGPRRPGRETASGSSEWPRRSSPADAPVCGDVREVSRNVFVLSPPKPSVAPHRLSSSAPSPSSSLDASSAALPCAFLPPRPAADAYPPDALSREDRPDAERERRKAGKHFDGQLRTALSAAAVLSFADRDLASFRLLEIAKLFGRLCQLTNVRGEDLKDDPRYARLVTALDLRLQEELQDVTRQIVVSERRQRKGADRRGEQGVAAENPESGEARGWRAETGEDGERGEENGVREGAQEDRRESTGVGRGKDAERDRVTRLRFELGPADLVALGQALRLSQLALDLDMVLRNLELLALLQLPSFSLSQICQFVVALGHIRTTSVRPLSRPFLSRVSSHIGVLLSASLEGLAKKEAEAGEGRRQAAAARRTAREARRAEAPEDGDGGEPNGDCGAFGNEGRVGRRQEGGARAGRQDATRGDNMGMDDSEEKRPPSMPHRLCQEPRRETGTLSSGNVGRAPGADVTLSLASAVNHVMDALPFLSIFEEESFLFAEHRTPSLFTEAFRRTLGLAWAETVSLEDSERTRDSQLVPGLSPRRESPGQIPFHSLADLNLHGGSRPLEWKTQERGASEATSSREREANKEGLERINQVRCVAKTVKCVLKTGNAGDQTVISALTRVAVSLVSDNRRDAEENPEGENEERSLANSRLSRRLARARALLEVVSALSEAGALSQELWRAVRRDVRLVLPYLSLYQLDLAARLHFQTVSDRASGRMQHDEERKGWPVETRREAEVDVMDEEQTEVTERGREDRKKREEAQFLDSLLRVFRAQTRSMNNREISAFADRLVAEPTWLRTANSPTGRDLVATVFSESRERYIDAKEDTYNRDGLSLRPLMNLALFAGGCGVVSLQVMFDFLLHILQIHRADVKIAIDFDIMQIQNRQGVETLFCFILDKAEEIVENLRKSAPDLPDDLYAELQNFSIAVLILLFQNNDAVA
ncbi:conserved hypothetical protein [Neospora caninum Liverpool]|uniref:Uncharacterized protein n=1 Tax=Neospora caninum (strain Liverpool) TaxID=572307 RepID=F0VMG7_NEOCL|nr:conserved hypothetical protein [Neospora caninum Liverpool]CBZ54913.1 conserved hypothetical protein [Neospora caninum Liverpool]|eukprot:XP_003884941.1 conserved hypothetical protein [Neospora caninum Liverpool]